MEATKKKGKKIGWRLTRRGKQNIEFVGMMIFAIATVGYIMGGVWLLYAIMTSGGAL